MTTETQQALAVLFRRFKDERVKRDALVKAMSLELDWTKPSRAENLLDRGLNGGHLEQDDEGALAAAFDPQAVDVPFGFAPSEELFEPVETAPEQPPGSEQGGPGPSEHAPPERTALLDDLLDAIAERLDGERNRAVAAANARQEAMGGLVTLETAALLVAHEHGLTVADRAEDVLEALRSQAGATSG